MRVLLILISLILINNVQAKVAYLPVTKSENNGRYSNNSLIALDLTTGNVLNELNYNQVFLGPIFLNSTNSKLYTATSKGITLIKASSLEVTKEWKNISGFPVNLVENVTNNPVQIVLNNANDKLFYLIKNQESLYQLDLVNDSVTPILSFDSEVIRKIWVSEDHNILVLKTSNLSEGHIRTYDLNSLTQKHVFSINNALSLNIGLVSNDGESYYYFDYPSNSLHSKNLSDNSLNWVFDFIEEQQGDKLFENNNSITVIGSINTQQLNKLTGVGQIVSTTNTQLFDSKFEVDKIDEGIYFATHYPHIICLRTGCSSIGSINASILNITNQSNDVIFNDSTIIGSRVTGYYIGNNLAVQQTIPVFNKPLSLLLLFGLILLLAYKSHYQRTKIC